MCHYFKYDTHKLTESWQTSSLYKFYLYDWIALGHFERHIRRMQHLYDFRRQVLIKARKDYFGERVTILRENAGIHVMVKIKKVLMSHK